MGLLSNVFAFDHPTIAINANDATALTSQEIYNWQLAQGMQQSAIGLSLRGLMATSQYQAPQRPLDERFADFKARLAAAISKYSMTAT